MVNLSSDHKFDSKIGSGDAARPFRRDGFRPERYATLFFFLAFYLVFAILKGSAFASWGNVTLALGQNAHLAFLAAAVTITLIAGQFDLSVGACAGMATVIMAHCTATLHWSIWPSALLVVAVGVVAGLLNGFLVVGLHLNAFIATLGTGGAMVGVAIWLSDGQTIYQGIPEALTSIGAAKILDVPIPVYFVLALLVVGWVLTRRTVLGRYWDAVGSNVDAARLAGVKTNRTIVLAFVGTSVIASLGGLVFLARYGSADSSTGPQWLLPAFAAAFLGSSILSDGRFIVIGSILATYLIAMAQNALDISGVNVAIQPVFNGAVLIVAVALTQSLRRRRRTGKSPIRS